MAERGVTQNMVNSWTKSGTVIQQSSGNYLYITQEGAAVLNSSGKLITTYPNSYYNATMLDVVNKLFGK